ncbi:hypothetical protein [Glycomyces sp. NPDC047010]|uniref:hypothetical protein n=1 Tax=Glycomyces sp. NPDC047010 TaxID=3155023 RepID=UPI0033E8E393
MQRQAKAVLAAGFAAVAATALAAPAAAAEGPGDEPDTRRVDDSFTVTTLNDNGYATFVDYGPGKPGHGMNDDYIEIDDTWADGYDVRVEAWLDGDSQGVRVYDDGAWGDVLVWDPFPNVKPGQEVELEVCLTDSSGIHTQCGEGGDVSADG